jgi:hypothetical protein
MWFVALAVLVAFAVLFVILSRHRRRRMPVEPPPRTR